jgi:SAM-dependent methyltransferase
MTVLSDGPTQEVLGDCVVHGDATVVRRSPLQVVTTARQWAYAATYSFRQDEIAALLHESGGRVVVELSVIRGRVGVGLTTSTGDAFVVERFVSDRVRRMSLLIPPRISPAALVLRNASDAGESEFIVTTVRVESLRGTFTYPVQVAAREFGGESVPRDGGPLTVFDTDAALGINRARLEWLREADLVKTGSRVLDVGAGVGHFLPYYLDRGCTVVALDGRAENVAELRARFPAVEAHVADAQRLDPGSLGRFDVIHCFGLLYHLESPIAALRSFRELCTGIVILETMVCDASRPVSVLADETRAASQALDGLGCRPSPAFVALALNRVGFRYVYGATPPPRHEDFQFEWQDDLETVRNGHPLRCVFVAGDEPLDHPRLFPVVD